VWWQTQRGHVRLVMTGLPAHQPTQLCTQWTRLLLNTRAVGSVPVNWLLVRDLRQREPPPLLNTTSLRCSGTARRSQGQGGDAREG
jgi:hypothetical protein